MRHQQEMLQEPTKDGTECQVHMTVGSCTADHSASFSGWFSQRFSKTKPRSPTKQQLAFTSTIFTSNADSATTSYFLTLNLLPVVNRTVQFV